MASVKEANRCRGSFASHPMLLTDKARSGFAVSSYSHAFLHSVVKCVYGGVHTDMI